MWISQSTRQAPSNPPTSTVTSQLKPWIHNSALARWRIWFRSESNCVFMSANRYWFRHCAQGRAAGIPPRDHPNSGDDHPTLFNHRQASRGKGHLEMRLGPPSANRTGPYGVKPCPLRYCSEPARSLAPCVAKLFHMQTRRKAKSSLAGQLPYPPRFFGEFVGLSGLRHEPDAVRIQ